MRASTYSALVTLASVAFVLSFAAPAAAGDLPPEYSPLPPPPPPVADPAARPVARPAPVPARAPAPAANAAPANAPQTTTTSATIPASSVGGTPTQPPPDPDTSSSGRAGHTANLDDERFSIAPFLGFGTNNLDLGVGARAGIVVAAHVWVGGTFVYHTGTSTAGIINGVPYSVSASMFYFGPEAGYDFELGPIILRPYAGIGIGSFTASTSGNPNATLNVSDTQTKLLIWPGVTALYGFPGAGGRFFVGGDTRVISVPNGPAFAAYGVGGMTL